MRAVEKILSHGALAREVEAGRAAGRRVVFTNGCFDLLHAGHLRYLEDARREGDALIVAVNTDASVWAMKGPGRPVTPEAERAELVAGLHCVTWVTLFDTPDPLPLIMALRPDVLVKGADWPLDRIVGAREVTGWGGRVVRVPLTPGRSTTAIIREIVSRFAGGAGGPGAPQDAG